MSLTGGYATTNFVPAVTDFKLTNVLNWAMTAPITAVTLTPTAVSVGAGTKVHLLKIEFFQKVNTVQY